MSDSTQPQDITYAEIDLTALKHNIGILKQQAANSRIIAVIKANAYGHGMVTTATELQHTQQVDALAVARLSEAITLRESAITLPIILLEGFFNPEDISTLLDYQLQTVVHSQQQLQAILCSQLAGQLKVWLKIDTGMHRLGFHPEQIPTALASLEQSQLVEQPINLMSHFQCADELDNPTTRKQIQLFQSLATQHKGLSSLANSAGVLAWPDSHLDMVRPGISIYGISPFIGTTAQEHQLKPVMTLKSQLIAVREHKQGESVGYGAIWRAQQDTQLGVIAIGYGDGYPRMAPEGTPVLVNGRLVPIVGRVSMDMITVDLGLNCSDQVGDSVTLWGEGLPIEIVAKHIGTIAYELSTKLTNRVPLSYLK